MFAPEYAHESHKSADCSQNACSSERNSGHIHSCIACGVLGFTQNSDFVSLLGVVHIYKHKCGQKQYDDPSAMYAEHLRNGTAAESNSGIKSATVVFPSQGPP